MMAMDPETVSAQQTRALAFLSHQAAAVSQFAALLIDVEYRSRSQFRRRLNWDEFVTSYKEKVTPYLYDADREMASLRGGKISAELHLYSTLRYLAGGSYSDICVFCGISVAAFYQIVWRTIHAINKAIAIDFPSTTEECAILASDFQDVSYGDAITNCVGAVDGFLLAIQVPAKKWAKNVRSYFSGHYQKYGVNIQASCDAHCRFTFLGVGGPGVMKDRQAIHESGLFERVEALPNGYVCIADCAYQPTERMVPIFGGDLGMKKDNDNFNCYASQLRIRIEMAFGMMTRKWGILQRPLSNTLPSVKHIICCIARLHNFCINERLKKAPVGILTTRDSLSGTQKAYMYAAAQAEYQDIISYEYPQWSLAREALVKRVRDKHLERPTKN